jgi:hypothetical protein
MLATVVVPELQVPPPVASVRDTVPPRQIVFTEGFIAPGVWLIVTMAVEEQVPMAYDIVSMPAVTPVTTPAPLTVAFALLLDHTPPVVASVRLMVLPVQTVEVAGTMATGAVLTVTISVAEQVPIV